MRRASIQRSIGAVALVLWLVPLADRCSAGEEDGILGRLGNLKLAVPGLEVGGKEDDQVAFSASFQLANAEGRTGTLAVKLQIAPKFHVFSLTQPQAPGAGMPSKLSVVTEQVRVTGPWQADRKPTIRHNKIVEVPLEEHEDEVTFTAPIELADAARPDDLEIEVRYSGQVCGEGSCRSLKSTVLAKLASAKPAPVSASSFLALAASEDDYRAARSHTAIRVELAPSAVRPGETVTIIVTALPDKHWHTYRYATEELKTTNKPTRVAFTNTNEWKVTGPRISSKPLPNPEKDQLAYHEGTVHWSFEFAIPASVKPGEYELAGIVGYQSCKAEACDPPGGARFLGKVRVGDTRGSDSVRCTVERAKYAAVLDQIEEKPESQATPPKPEPAPQVAPPRTEPADRATDGSPERASQGLDLGNLRVDHDTKNASLWIVLPTAFAAGFILNFMPCVLPVLGLKLMSFVQQAGEHRGRVLMLNIAYSAGIIAVFLVLATLAVAPNLLGVKERLGWGAQFGNTTFNIVLISVVFVFALSLLGVWEIPIPGFVGAGGADKLASREGAAGAFFKGVLSTVLATPCGGPLLAPALAWALSQPKYLSYLGFTCVGLGMASPYLLVGAFPRLLAFLPKPGEWMEAFKHMMGFVMLGTVVFLLTFLAQAYVVPTVGLLMALWAGFWWIGRVPVWESIDKRLSAWIGGLAFAGVVGFFVLSKLPGIMEARIRSTYSGTAALVDAEDSLPWERFSLKRLEELTAAKTTVLVDFTADWCGTCKTNELVALNRPSVKSTVAKNRVVTLKADKTYDGEETDVIDSLLRAMGNASAQIPFCAIFPADDPNRPILLDGILTQDKVLAALQKAGPSATAATGGTTSEDTLAAARTETGTQSQ